MASAFEPSVNHVPPLHAKSNAGDNADVVAWIDPSTHRLLVDANISLSASDIQIGAVEIKDGTSDVRQTVLDLTNSNPGAVAIVDANGTQITSFGGGTQYTEGDTDTTITGTVTMWEDASNTLVATSASKPFPVEIIAGAGSGGTAAADDADFTAGTTSGTPAMGVYESTPTSVTDGDLGTVGITQGRRLKTSATIDAALPAGTNAIGKLSANSGVDIGDVDVASIAAGDNNIGNVDIASIAAGDNNIGNVDIVSSALPTGASTLAEQQSQTTHLATIAGDTTAIETAVQIMDDWDETDRAKVNIIAGQAGVAAGAGAVGATTQRVTLASDDPAVTALQILDNAISGSEMQVDVVAALPAGSAIIGRTGHDITGIGHGVTTVTTAGTDVALAASTACKRVTIQSQTDNTGLIAVGATGVDATVATGTGVLLSPGDAFELEIDNLADIFIDSTVNGEGVRYTYFT